MTTNEARAAGTRAKLTEAGRSLFARDGYAATGTEAILEKAGVTRGALYHHYRDKAELFEAVCRELSAEAAAAIGTAIEGLTSPYEMLEKGSLAWIEFMAKPEARRILVVDAPGVLGWQRWNALDRDLSFQALRDGVAAALDAGEVRFAAGPDALTVLLNGAMNAVALQGSGEERLGAGFVEMLERFRE